MSTRFLENETVHLLQEMGSETAPPQERTPPVLLGCNPPSTVRLSLNALSTRPRAPAGGRETQICAHMHLQQGVRHLCGIFA